MRVRLENILDTRPKFPQDGRYTVEVRTRGDRSTYLFVHMDLNIDLTDHELEQIRAYDKSPDRNRELLVQLQLVHKPGDVPGDSLATRPAKLPSIDVRCPGCQEVIISEKKVQELWCLHGPQMFDQFNAISSKHQCRCTCDHSGEPSAACPVHVPPKQ